MRPSSVETSEPACVKRKMLSMNSSTSCFCTSRKYSAIVRAESATRRRVPGGSSIWPKTRAVLSKTPASSEEADLAAEHVRRQEVDDLDAGLEHLRLRLELVEVRRLAVDAPALGDLDLLARLGVEHLADDVEDLALGDVADRHGDGAAGVAHF